MNTLFRFEEDLRETLPCVPMAVRYKLDVVGVKLQLKEWLKLSDPERRELLEWPWDSSADEDAFRARLTAMVARRTGAAPQAMEPATPLWDLPDPPAALTETAAAQGLSLGDAPWRGLSRLQRFALLKLSRPGHENRNFLSAVREFGLLP